MTARRDFEKVAREWLEKEGLWLRARASAYPLDTDIASLAALLARVRGKEAQRGESE